MADSERCKASGSNRLTGKKISFFFYFYLTALKHTNRPHMQWSSWWWVKRSYPRWPLCDLHSRAPVSDTKNMKELHKAGNQFQTTRVICPFVRQAGLAENYSQVLSLSNPKNQKRFLPTTVSGYSCNLSAILTCSCWPLIITEGWQEMRRHVTDRFRVGAVMIRWIWDSYKATREHSWLWIVI